MEAYTGKLISNLYRRTLTFWGNFLKEYEITTAEYPVLIVLNRKDGITQEEICSELSVDKSGITRVIQSLLEKGWIIRKKDEKDLRCNRIYLTEAGRELWPVIQKGIHEWERITSLNLSDTEKEEAARIITIMLKNLEETLGYK